MSVPDLIKDEVLKDRSTLHYKGKKDDGSWTEEQTIDLCLYFGDSDGYFVDNKDGYCKKSKDEKVIRQHLDAERLHEPKLVATMLKDDGHTYHEAQGIFRYLYFDVVNGTLQYAGPIPPK